MSDIIGRVIYCLRNAVDHGPVPNRFAYFLLLVNVNSPTDVHFFFASFSFAVLNLLLPIQRMNMGKQLILMYPNFFSSVSSVSRRIYQC